MAKVVSLDGARNQKIHYPVVGILEHDSNGVAEVPDDKVDELLMVRKDHLMLESDYKLLIVEKHKERQQKRLPKNHKPEAGMLDLEEDEEEKDGNNEKDEEVNDEEFRTRISGETKIALQAMCEDFEYPQGEWNQLKKADLIDYMVKKTNEKK